MVIGVVRPSDSSGAEIDSRKFSGEQRRGAGRQAAGGDRQQEGQVRHSTLH